MQAMLGDGTEVDLPEGVEEYIAGRDAHLYDKTDWMQSQVSVYINPANLPPTLPLEEVVRMLQESINCWSRYSVKFRYKGTTNVEYIPGAIVINWQTEKQLASWYKSTVNGVCFTRTNGDNNEKGNRWVEGCRIYINLDNRWLPDNYTQATLSHELGHACGIHGHNSNYGSLMYRSSMGNTQPTLFDFQMLDDFNPNYTMLHDRNRYLTVPVVPIPDPGSPTGYQIHYVRLRPVNGLAAKWLIHDAVAWNPAANEEVQVDGVRLGDPMTRNGRHGQMIHLDDVRGLLDGQKVHIAADLFLDGEDQTLELVADRTA